MPINGADLFRNTLPKYLIFEELAVPLSQYGTNALTVDAIAAISPMLRPIASSDLFRSVCCALAMDEAPTLHTMQASKIRETDPPVITASSLR